MVISHHLPLKRGYKSHSKPFKNLAHQKHHGNNFTGVFLRVLHPAESESGLCFVQKTLPELLQYLHSLLVHNCIPRILALQARECGCATVSGQ